MRSTPRSSSAHTISSDGPTRRRRRGQDLGVQASVRPQQSRHVLRRRRGRQQQAEQRLSMAIENGFSRTFGESGPAVGGTPGGSCLSSWQYAMSPALLPAPRELELISMAPGAHGITIHLRAKRKLVPCPDCGELTDRIHERKSDEKGEELERA